MIYCHAFVTPDNCFVNCNWLSCSSHHLIVFVIFGGQAFQQTVGIPMGTNCAPLYLQICFYIHMSSCKLFRNKKTRNWLSPLVSPLGI